MNNALHMTLKHSSLKPLLTAGALAIALVSGNSALAATHSVDGVSVLVNDAAITKSEIEQATAQLRAQNRNAPIEQLRKAALEELIMISLQEQEALRMGLSVDNATLDRAMQSLAKQNQLSLTDFRKQITANGMTWPELRESVRKQILLERLREREVLRRINVSEQEIDDYLAEQDANEGHPQYQLEHFVVPLPGKVTAQVRSQAEAAVNQLQRALQNKLSAQQIVGSFRSRNIPIEGGPLGWRKADDLPSPMNTIVPKLQTGAASEPVVDAQGIHVLRLLAVRQNKANTVEQSKARHILLKLNPLRDASKAEQELATIRKQIVGGDDFAAMAHKYSEDYASAVVGGDLGWFGAGAMVPAFENRLKLLSPGQLSQPFESPFGWHLVELEDRRQAKASTAERRQKAHAAIAETKRGKTTQRWLQQLRDQAFLEYPNDPE
ncbi:MAG: peptidylprolyl isomerase [Granulosicoccaceae bacterium]